MARLGLNNSPDLRYQATASAIAGLGCKPCTDQSGTCIQLRWEESL
jgi:hypothetical protein